jgi:Ca2+-binding RTX toxin-like protein
VTGTGDDDRLFGGTRDDLTAILSPDEAQQGLDREVIIGLRGDDLIVGAGAADWLVGGRGQDEIYGGAGDDIIAGGGTVYDGSYWWEPGRVPVQPGTVFPVLQDTLILDVDLTDAILTLAAVQQFEAAGRVIRGQFDALRDRDNEDGADTVFAGSGKDEVWAGWGDDYVDGEAGADTVYGEEGGDTLFGGDGDDNLFGDGEAMLPANHGADYLDGEAGNDTLVGGGGEDTLFGGDDEDQLFGDSELIDPALHADDYLDGESGDDSLFGYGGDDELYGGDGKDWLSGGVGDDYLDGEGGDDALLGEGGEDEIFGGTGHDELAGGEDADHLEGEEGADRLLGEAGEDTLIGGPGNDELRGGSENDTLYGGAGSDELFGDDGNDLLSGGPGADTLRGGAGDDTYLIVRGDHQDTIVDTDGDNRIRFLAAAGPEDLSIAQVGTGTDVTIAYSSESDAVIVTDGAAGAVRAFEFFDGTVRTLKQVLDAAHADTMSISGSGSGATFFGGSNDDTLTAGPHDRLHGGRGDDTLFGSTEESALEFSRGDGHDRVRGSGLHTFVFDETVSRHDLSASHADPLDANTLTPRDLVLTYGDTSTPDTIAVESNARTPFQTYWFRDGRLTHVQLLERSGLALDWLGSSDQETVSGTRFEDRLSGAGGDDVLQGQHGDDDLRGGAGSDDLAGGAGNDVLVGGTGADTLQGNAGDDRYTLGAGDGIDILVDGEGDNVIEFGAGIALADVDADLISGTDANLYLAIRYTQGDTLLVRQNFGTAPSHGSIAFTFGDGTHITAAELSSLKFDTPLNFSGTTEALRITGSGFDDTIAGSTRDDRLEGGAGDDRIAGDQGHDALFGNDGDDLLVGNSGDDLLQGGAGADTYRFQLGMGRDTLVEHSGDSSTLVLGAGLVIGDLAYERLDDDVYVHVANGRDGVQIVDYFEPGSTAATQSWTLQLSDGTTAELHSLLGDAIPESVRSATVDELMSDFSRRAQAFSQSRLLAEGYELQPDGSLAQHTTFSSSTHSSHTVTTVRFALPTQSTNAVSITRSTDILQTVSFTTSQATTHQTVQQLITAGSQFVPLGAGANLSSSGAPGYVVVSGSSTSIGQTGTVAVAIPSSLATFDPFSGALRTAPNGFQIFAANTTPEYFSTTFTHRHTEQTRDERLNIETIVAGDANSLIRVNGPTIVDAGAGDDRIDAQSFLVMRDPGEPGVLLHGNAGDDALSGSNFEDVLVGGAGSDTLWGGPENDLYVVVPGSGIDEIVEGGSSLAARNNVLRLPAAASLDNLIFSWSEELRGAGDPASAGYASSTHSVHAVLTLSWGDDDAARIVVPHSDAGWTGIDFVEFADGQRLSFHELVSRSPADLNPHHRDNVLSSTGAIGGGPGSDTLEAAAAYGGDGDDTIRASLAVGGGGADTLFGTTANDALIGGSHLGRILVSSEWLGSFFEQEGDVFRGGRGNDTISASTGADTFEFELGDGIDTVRDLQHDLLYFYYGGSLDVLLPDMDAAARRPEHRALVLTNSDTLRFANGITPEDIEFVREPTDSNEQLDALLVRHRNGSDGVRFAQWYMSDPYTGDRVHNQLGRIEFADGTVWERETISNRAAAAPRIISGAPWDDFIGGTALSETIAAGEGMDWLAGREGDDVLDGGADDDTYIFDAGDGFDSIVETGESAFDVVRFGSGIAAEDLTLGVGSLLIRIGNTGDAIRIGAFDPNNALGSGIIESFEFADGTSLSYAQLLERGFDIEGSLGDDALFGTSVVDRIDGSAGDDVIDAGAADDTLEGGSGIDMLRGGSGDDTYRFGVGSGEDHIEDSAGTRDTLVLGSGLDPAATRVARSGSRLLLTFDGYEDRLSIRQSDDYGIEEVRFHDGTVWDATALESHVVSGNVAPVVQVPIADTAADEDAVLSFLVPAETFSDPGDTLSLRAALTGGAALPEWLAFDPGTRTFSGTPASDHVGVFEVTVTATDSGGLSASDAFSIVVNNTNDAPALVQPLADASVMERQPFTLTLPETAFEDIDASDVLAYRATLTTGDPLPAWLAFDSATRTFSGTPGESDVRTHRILVTAADASGAEASDDFDLKVLALPGAALVGTPGPDTLVGTAGADTMQGLAGADRLHGLAGQDALFGDEGPDYLAAGTGDDLLFAGGGNDLLIGDAGDDALDGGAGSDALWGGAGADVLSGGDDADVLYGDDGADLLMGDAGNDVLTGGRDADVLYGGPGKDVLSGDTGLDLLFGNAQDDVLTASAGNDLLAGGSGDDNLDAGADNDFIAGGTGTDVVKPGAGSDVIAFNRGHGADSIQATGAVEDTLSLGGGIRYSDLRLSKNGRDLVLAVGAGDRITFSDWYSPTPARSIGRLQVIADATLGFDPASSDPLLSSRVQTFDFRRIVGAFDAARSKNPALTSWTVLPVLASAWTGGSDTEAWAGALAHQFGHAGSLDDPTSALAGSVLSENQFGLQPQAFADSVPLHAQNAPLDFNGAAATSADAVQRLDAPQPADALNKAPPWRGSIERWLEHAMEQTDVDIQPRGAVGLTATELDIAAAWQRTQRLLDAHLQRRGAAGEFTDSTPTLGTIGLATPQRISAGALGAVSEHRLTPLGGLREGFDLLSG